MGIPGVLGGRVIGRDINVLMRGRSQFGSNKDQFSVNSATKWFKSKGRISVHKCMPGS